MNSKDFIIDGTTLVKYIGHDTIIEIPNCVTEIGREAFYRCWWLEEVYFPFSVDVIGSHAFEDCENLRKVKLPTLLKSIESYGFYRCVRLESITFPDELINIGDYSFYECVLLKKVPLPENVKNVGDYAFSECRSLKHLTVHKNLINMGVHSFYHSSLNQINVIDKESFCKVIFDKSYKKLLMCESHDGFWYGIDEFEEIGEYAFAGCKTESYLFSGNEKEIFLPYGVKKIGAYAFRESNMTHFIVPPKVKIIDEGTFAYCKDLVSIEMVANVKKIHINAFVGCEKLDEIIVHKDKMDIQINGIADKLKVYVDEFYDKILSLKEFIQFLLKQEK